MKNLLSKLNKFGVFAFALGLLLIGTQSAFKAAANLDPLEDGWYEIFITDTDFPEVEANQQIVGTTPLPLDPPETDLEGCAQTLNDGFRCAVYLDFDGEVEEMPATVDDVDGDEVQLTDEARQPE